MKKHLMLRFNAPTGALKADMDKLAAQMENMGYEEMIKLAEATREVSELDYLISKIDAIQAELWRRQQQPDEG